MGKKVKKIVGEDGKPVRWDHHDSLTRDMLKDDIKEKNVTRALSLDDVISMRKECALCDRDKFAEHLEKLLNDAEERDKRAVRDEAAVKQFRRIHPPPAMDKRGEPRWEGSLAQKSLYKDMENGLHKNKKPGALHKDRDECKRFGQTKFRNHIHQKIRSDKFQNYLNDKSAEANKWKKNSDGNSDK